MSVFYAPFSSSRALGRMARSVNNYIVISMTYEFAFLLGMARQYCWSCKIGLVPPRLDTAPLMTGLNQLGFIVGA
jgi:hypothetical protein